MKSSSMRDLLVHELQDLYGAEQQLVKALPLMVRASTSRLLASTLETHLRQTHTHVTRLERCLELMGVHATGVICDGMEGLLREGEEMALGDFTPLVRDAGLIGAARRIEHYEMSSYDTCASLATLLAEDAVAKLLRATLEEARAANVRLNSIAHTEVNLNAMPRAETAGVS